MAIDLAGRIPNNVGLAEDPKIRRALEQWQPRYLEWWRDMGPSDFREDEVWLRTAVGVGRGGWANFGWVKMPEYRWGIFLAEPEPERKIGFGDPAGQPVWREVPGELRTMLRRLIVTQADTEPASVEQQRLLGRTAPSLVDLRNLLQVNVEEGRHLWAMVYLLHKYFGSDGRDEGEDLLRRRSGNLDNPRLLLAFNKPVRDWLEFFCFTTFTDRDGKYQLAALAESGFDPLSRTTRFMLTEEAHHLAVGGNGVARVVERTAQLMSQGVDPRKVGAIPIEILQRYVNDWVSSSHDLFGSEDSTNAADAFSWGLKGRFRESRGALEPTALGQVYTTQVLRDGRLCEIEIPLRRAMNALLCDAYHADCLQVAERWNRILARHHVEARIEIPSQRFNRQIGLHAGKAFDPHGLPVAADGYGRRLQQWLPDDRDRAHVASCMVLVSEPGRFAGWIAPPASGVDGKPVDFEYVRVC